MPTEPGHEPLDDDEVVYRRIPVNPSFYDPERDSKPSPQAFKPREDDTTGISVFRAKYVTPEEVTSNPRGRPYYVAALRVGDLRAEGIEVLPRPNEDGPGHAEIPALTYETRKLDSSKERMLLLAHRLCVVTGPHGGAPR